MPDPIIIPTPDYGSRSLDPSVYEPAEDSFILLDALEHDAASIRAARPTVCVEIGSGSGIASCFLAKILEKVSSALVLSTDINPRACEATRHTATLNFTSSGSSKSGGDVLNPIRMNLVSSLASRLEQSGGVDILLFNPPYVPTEPAEVDETQRDADIGATWAGGDRGMAVTDRVLEQLPRILSPTGGRMYLVAVSGNRPGEMIKRINERDDGFEAEVVLERRAGRERLYVLRITRRE